MIEFDRCVILECFEGEGELIAFTAFFGKLENIATHFAHFSFKNFFRCVFLLPFVTALFSIFNGIKFSVTTMLFTSSGGTAAGYHGRCVGCLGGGWFFRHDLQQCNVVWCAEELVVRSVLPDAKTLWCNPNYDTFSVSLVCDKETDTGSNVRDSPCWDGVVSVA